MTLTRFIAVLVCAASHALAAEGVTITGAFGAGHPIVIKGDKAVFDLSSGEIKVSGKDASVDTGSDYLFLVEEATLQGDGICRIIPRKPQPFRKPRPPKPDARYPQNSTPPGHPDPAQPQNP